MPSQKPGALPSHVCTWRIYHLSQTSDRHVGRANVAHVDGHAEAVRALLARANENGRVLVQLRGLAQQLEETHCVAP